MPSTRRARYQSRSDERFDAQPDRNPHRNPHRMVHYGQFVFRPLSPLAFFDPGVDGFTGSTVFLEGHRQNSANFSEARQSSLLLRFGQLTPAFLLQTVAPLLIIFLAFARPLAHPRGLPPVGLQPPPAGRLVSPARCLVCPRGASSRKGRAMKALLADLRLLLRSRFSVAALVVLWLLSVLANAAGLSAVARQNATLDRVEAAQRGDLEAVTAQYTQPGSHVGNAAYSTFLSTWDRPSALAFAALGQRDLQPFFAKHPQWRDRVPVTEDFQWIWYYAMHEVGDDAVAPLVLDYRRGLAARQTWTERLGVWSPAASVQTLVHRIADTDLQAHLAYQDSIAAFHERLRGYLHPLIIEDRPPDRAAFASLPAFSPRASSASLPWVPLLAPCGFGLLALGAGLPRE